MNTQGFIIMGLMAALGVVIYETTESVRDLEFGTAIALIDPGV